VLNRVSFALLYKTLSKFLKWFLTRLQKCWWLSQQTFLQWENSVCNIVSCHWWLNIEISICLETWYEQSVGGPTAAFSRTPLCHGREKCGNGQKKGCRKSYEGLLPLIACTKLIPPSAANLQCQASAKIKATCIFNNKESREHRLCCLQVCWPQPNLRLPPISRSVSGSI
jgi:hypothetical protein